MPARQKLNASYALGSAVVAGLIGALTGSWIAFSLARAVLLAANLIAGEIRLGSRRP